MLDALSQHTVLSKPFIHTNQLKWADPRDCVWLELRRLPQILSPCSFLLWILTHKRFHSNLAIAPTCDTVSTYHITDKARDPQRGLSRATYLLNTKSVAGRLWRAGRSAAGGGDAAASDLQIKGGGARQGTVKGTAARKATGLHLGQRGQGRLLEVGAPIDPELTADAEEKGDVGPLGAGAGTSLHRQRPPRAPAPGGRQAQRRRAPAAQELPLASAAE